MNVIPEAQLQAYVLGLTREAFPHLPPESFRIEKHFKLQFGHNLHDHDGTLYWEAQGRADLLVFQNERPLALFELKREDKILQEKDFRQGQSYTAALFPRPPLIIVSNGHDTWVRQVDDGAELPKCADAAVIKKIFENVDALHNVVRQHRLLARDALADEQTPDPELALASANAFVIRRDALTASGEDAAVKLEAQAWVSFYRHPTGEDVVGFRVPELFMSELAHQLADLVNTQIEADPDEAWLVLASQAQRFFLGDIVGAQALFDLGKKRSSLPVSLIEPLMNDPPTVESIAGKTIGLQQPDGTILNLRFNAEGGVALADAEGNALSEYSACSEDDAPGTMYGNMISWMIVSQFARVRSTSGTTIEHRLDLQIMLCVGRAEIPLMRGGDFANLRPHSIQGLGKAGSTLSAAHALAEPLTSAIHKLFHEEWRNLDFFFEEVVRVNSLPLTCRVHHAFHMLQGSVDPDLEEWAAEKMASVVQPLMREQLEEQTV